MWGSIHGTKNQKLQKKKNKKKKYPCSGPAHLDHSPPTFPAPQAWQIETKRLSRKPTSPGHQLVMLRQPGSTGRNVCLFRFVLFNGRKLTQLVLAHPSKLGMLHHEQLVSDNVLDIVGDDFLNIVKLGVAHLEPAAERPVVGLVQLVDF
jgi:hypothetical protein